uniref:Histidine decarboxylase n=1 Tax=Magallana gigas TaxID=29159 RepID=K1R2A9_MAGGI
MVDFIAEYLKSIRTRRVFPDVSPGYMRTLVPEAAPQEGEKWDDIFRDIERVIMPGVTHWQSPYMHAYFPALNSFPSLLGDMLADAIGCLGFTWASSPACTELETIVMDWLGKMIGLPSEFLHSNKETKGGGVIQLTASDCTFITMLAARTEVFQKHRKLDPDVDEAHINARLVAYCSDQAHSSVEKAGLISLVKMRYLTTDDDLSMRGHTLQEAISRDKEDGLIPFYVCATLGTTGACAFDNIKELGLICKFRAAIDYMHWQIPLSRRFRALKLWFVIRSFGIEGLQKHVREGVRLTSKFEDLLRKDQRFEIPASRVLGMVVFRLWGENEMTETLLKRLNKSGKVHMVPASLKGKYVIRFTVTSQYTTDQDIERDWKIISDTATKVLHDTESEEDEAYSDEEVSSPEVEEEKQFVRVPSIKKKEYGMSLLLSNVPMSPKLINGSFAALFDDSEAMEEVAKQISAENAEHLIPMSPRKRKLRDQSKHQSFDQTTMADRCLSNSYKHQGSLDSKLDEIVNSSAYLETRMNGMQMDDVFEAEEERPIDDTEDENCPMKCKDDVSYNEGSTQTETGQRRVDRTPNGQTQSMSQRKNPNIRLKIPEVNIPSMRNVCPHCGNRFSFS